MVRVVYQKGYRRPLSDFVDMLVTLRLDKRSAGHWQQRQHRMAIFANDHIGIRINTYGVYEKEALDVVFDFLAPLRSSFSDGVALDVGANIGNHSLFFAERFAHVHAFEPHPETFELLKFNVRQLPNVSAHHAGLGDKAGVMTLVEDNTNIGRSAIGEGSTSQRTMSVPIAVLDDFEVERDKLCFIKIDVEGFEANVIRGGMQCIAAAMPLIVLEQLADNFRAGHSESLDLLLSLGYTFCWSKDKVGCKPWLFRRVTDIRQILLGGAHVLVSGTEVPLGSYPMLIAVPPRFRQALGL